MNITINSIGTELSRDDRQKLFSDFGHMHPEGQRDLALCRDFEQVVSVIVNSTYQNIFQKSTSEEMMRERLALAVELRDRNKISGIRQILNSMKCARD